MTHRRMVELWPANLVLRIIVAAGCASTSTVVVAATSSVVRLHRPASVLVRLWPQVHWSQIDVVSRFGRQRHRLLLIQQAGVVVWPRLVSAAASTLVLFSATCKRNQTAHSGLEGRKLVSLAVCQPSGGVLGVPDHRVLIVVVPPLAVMVLVVVAAIVVGPVAVGSIAQHLEQIAVQPGVVDNENAQVGGSHTGARVRCQTELAAAAATGRPRASSAGHTWPIGRRRTPGAAHIGTPIGHTQSSRIEIGQEEVRRQERLVMVVVV